MTSPADQNGAPEAGAAESDAAFDAVVAGWHQQLVAWARDGRLGRAARLALNLPDQHPGLDQVVARLAAADLRDLPPIQCLDWDAMEGSPGAYAPQRQLVLINRDWLEEALAEQISAVLTEQLGHHLDHLFHPVATPVDEGELFLECLRRDPGSEAIALFRCRQEHGVVHLDGEDLEVEEAGIGAWCLDLRDLPQHGGGAPEPGFTPG